MHQLNYSVNSKETTKIIASFCTLYEQMSEILHQIPCLVIHALEIHLSHPLRSRITPSIIGRASILYLSLKPPNRSSEELTCRLSGMSCSAFDKDFTVCSLSGNGNDRERESEADTSSSSPLAAATCEQWS